MAGAEALPAERDRGGGDERGEGVEQQREQRGVDAAEGDEVAPGLERVAERAERQAGADVAGAERAQLAPRDDDPEQRGGDA